MRRIQKKMNTFTTHRDVYKYSTFIAPQRFYYYGLPGQVNDQVLISTKFPNTRGMFLAYYLRNIIEESDMYVLKPSSMSAILKSKLR